jgi:hypothetical protein
MTVAQDISFDRAIDRKGEGCGESRTGWLRQMGLNFSKSMTLCGGVTATKSKRGQEEPIEPVIAVQLMPEISISVAEEGGSSAK